MGSVLRKRIENGQPEGPGQGDGVGGLLAGCPGLLEHLTAVRYPDGSPRVTSTLNFFVESGLLKACLSDRDQGQAAFAAGVSLEDILAALESGLREDTLDWRVNHRGNGKKRQK